jgi:hypothetical protein
MDRGDLGKDAGIAGGPRRERRRGALHVLLLVILNPEMEPYGRLK